MNNAQAIKTMRRFSGILVMAILVATGCDHATRPDEKPPNVDTLAVLRQKMRPPEDCRPCHPQHFAEWQTSMHAYAFVDPAFFALNTIAHQRSGGQIDQFCVKCHSPLGSLLGETPPGFDPARLSSLAAAGISCDVCHSLAVDRLESGVSIRDFRLDGVRSGPIPAPRENGFHDSDYHPSYNRSEICRPCHNLLNPSGQFLLEATNREWDESAFNGMSIQCQNCHMPAYTGQAGVGGPMRQVHRHRFVGVDAPLVDFPGRDETVAAIDDLLKQAIRVSVAVSEIGAARTVKVVLTNHAVGHNIPSGSIFERQLWIETVFRTAAGDTLFCSGDLDPNGDLRTQYSDYVHSGQLPADSSLALFNGTPISQNHETLFFWEADRIENNTIPAGGSATAEYVLPDQAGTLSVRVRFRAFPPYLLRRIGLGALTTRLPVFDIFSYQSELFAP